MRNEAERLRRPAAAKYLGIAQSTLEKFVVTGGGPVFHKLGKTVVYDTRDLDAWLASKRRASSSDSGRERTA